MAETTTQTEPTNLPVTDEAKERGAEEMRLAKLNHPGVDWQADPDTGAPLIPGNASYETPETVTYNPPPPADTSGQYDVENQMSPAQQAKAEQQALEEQHKAQEQKSKDTLTPAKSSKS